MYTHTHQRIGLVASDPPGPPDPGGPARARAPGHQICVYI